MLCVILIEMLLFACIDDFMKSDSNRHDLFINSYVCIIVVLWYNVNVKIL